MIPKSRYFWPSLLVVVACVLGLGVYSYISSLLAYFSSDQVRQEFESRVGRAVGGRAVIGFINCDLSGVITITDIEVDTTPHPDGYPRLIIKIPKMQFFWHWADIVISDRMPIKELRIYNPTWTITSQKADGYYDIYGAPSLGLPIPPDPTGKINKDGSYVAPDSTLGWLVNVQKVKVDGGEIILAGQKGNVLGKISNVSFYCEGPPFKDVPLTDLQVSLPGSPLTVQALQFTASTDTSGGFFAKDIKAITNLGALSGSFQYTQATSQLNLHSDGITYDNLAGITGFLPNLFQDTYKTPISFDSQWTDLEFAHPRGTGHITFAPSQLFDCPAILQPLTLIHGEGGKIDPVSGSLNFSAFLDMDKRTARVNFQDMHCLFGLPLPAAVVPPAPAPTGRRARRPPPPPPITGSSITGLEAVGSGSCDFVTQKFTGLYDVPIKDPAVAAILTSATHAKQKIGDVWTFQVTSTGDLKTLHLETGKPVPPAPPASSAPKPTPTPAPTRRRHH